MAKPEWGTKRVCQSCGARFYDFGRSPIVCPACNTVFDVETLARSRRSRPTPRLADDANAPRAAGLGIDEEGEADERDDAGDESEDAAVVGDAGAEDDEDEEDNPIEDTADLGDDEDVSDVIEGDIDDDERH
jgi:uncharacterized protein (TIGR02300 family)